MHIVSVKTLREFWEDHADAESALKIWFREARTAAWMTFDDVKARFRSADVLRGNRVVFNIRGNKYRLNCSYPLQYRATVYPFYRDTRRVQQD